VCVNVCVCVRVWRDMSRFRKCDTPHLLCVCVCTHVYMRGSVRVLMCADVGVCVCMSVCLSVCVCVCVCVLVCVFGVAYLALVCVTQLIFMCVCVFVLMCICVDGCVS